MARRSTPRPAFTRPTVVGPLDAISHVWGDDTSGRVLDEVIVSSDLLHVLIFTLPPGGRFGHSGENRTIFGADEVYFVMEGTLLLIEPVTGEVRRAGAGTSVFFRRDTWHHGVNQGDKTLRVLETFAPPPATGTSSAYAFTRPFLADPRTADDRIFGRWPLAAGSIEPKLHLISEADRALRLEGDALIEVVASTEHLTFAVGELRPGCSRSLARHDGDACLHVTAGRVVVVIDDEAHDVARGDSLVVPRGYSYRCVNSSSDTVRFTLSVAPRYLPTAE